MRIKFHYILLAGLMFASCEKDNYAPPSDAFTGRIVYNGEPINVSQGDVFFELWESGWGKLTPINVAVGQDGTFSSLLFNAGYKLVIPSAQGPFMSKPDAATHNDTIMLDLHGSQALDIEVLPYYMVRTPAFSAAGRKVTAMCKLEQIIKDANAKGVERVYLYVNKTQFVDGRLNIAASSIAGGDIADLSNVSLQVDVPDIVPTQNYIFARIGLKISGVEDMIFSPVEKIEL